MMARTTPKKINTNVRKRHGELASTRGRAAPASVKRRGKGGGAPPARATARALEAAGADTGGEATDGGGSRSKLEGGAVRGAAAAGGEAGAQKRDFRHSTMRMAPNMRGDRVAV